MNTITPIYGKWTGSLLAGSIAGIACWTIPYPIDFMKTQIQSDLTYKLNMRSYLDSNMRKNLWRGFLPCILRSAIVNPFVFITYEYYMS